MPIPKFVTKKVCSGCVKVEGVPTAGIPVRLYRHDTGELVGSTVSGQDGKFSITTRYDGWHYAVAVYTVSGTNALIHDWLKPE